MVRYLKLSVVVFALMLAQKVFASEFDFSNNDYYAYYYYHQALSHDRIQNTPESQKIDKIAKSIGMKAKDLKRVLEKAEKIGEDPKAHSLSLIKHALAETLLKGRILDVMIDDSDIAHPVAYVQWIASDKDHLEIEALWVVYTIGQKIDFPKTIGVWAMHPKQTKTKKVFEATVAFEHAKRIQSEKIEKYGKKLYFKAFEGVKYPNPIE